MQEQQQNTMYYEEDEIDLRELYATIVKNKKTIFIVTAVITFLALAYIFIKTPIYEVKSNIKIGKIDNKLIDDRNDIVRTLSVVFHVNEKIKSKKKFVSDVASISVAKKDLAFLTVTTEGVSNKAALEKNEEVLHYLQNLYKAKIDKFKQNKKEEIKSLTNTIANLKEQNKFVEGLKKSKIKSKNDAEILKSLYIISSTFPVKIANLQQNILNLKYAILEQNTQNNQLVGSYIMQDKPAKPKKLLIVIVAFITGLILSIFLVFFIEFVKASKEEVK